MVAPSRMKKISSGGLQLLLTVGVWVLGQQAFGGFPPEVPGLSIPDARFLAEDQGVVIRASAPKQYLPQLKALGVTRVLIIKEEVREEVRTEIADLKALGYVTEGAGSQVIHIPYRWKDFVSFKEACLQTRQALTEILAAAQKKGEKLLFHCTFGQDRTGAVSGLYRMLKDRWELERTFHDELCENGYEGGNPLKPSSVNFAIEQELTPLFLSLAVAIQDGRWTADNLDPAICDQGAELKKALVKGSRLDPDRFRCQKSTKWRDDTQKRKTRVRRIK